MLAYLIMLVPKIIFTKQKHTYSHELKCKLYSIYPLFLFSVPNNLQKIIVTSPLKLNQEHKKLYTKLFCFIVINL